MSCRLVSCVFFSKQCRTKTPRRTSPHRSPGTLRPHLAPVSPERLGRWSSSASSRRDRDRSAPGRAETPPPAERRPETSGCHPGRSLETQPALGLQSSPAIHIQDFICRGNPPSSPVDRPGAGGRSGLCGLHGSGAYRLACFEDSRQARGDEIAPPGGPAAGGEIQKRGHGLMEFRAVWLSLAVPVAAGSQGCCLPCAAAAVIWWIGSAAALPPLGSRSWPVRPTRA